jgi:hypothetical protein
MLRALMIGVLVCGCCSVASAQVIGHQQVGPVPTLPQATMVAIGQQAWLFTHASVGGNMIDGMNALHSGNSTRYKLVTAWVGDSGSRANNPPTPTMAGTIYDCNRGNPGWQAKITYFDNSVRISGWHTPAVVAALDKMCYIDQTANTTTYLNSMAALEASYPATRFVYATMPLMTSSDSDNVLRNQYNAAVRAYCTSNGRLLLDIADIEAFDPNGVQYTFTSGGQTYQRMYPGYSSDGGHLNAAGSERVALGWYAAAAALVPTGRCGDLNGDSHTNAADFTSFTNCYLGPDVPRDGSPPCPGADLNQDNDVDLGDFAAFQVCVES